MTAVGVVSWPAPMPGVAGGAAAGMGAPPDMFNQKGQNWSQPPWHPERLAESGHAAYRDMLRATKFRLFRLWWIPVGGGRPAKAPTCTTTTRP